MKITPLLMCIDLLPEKLLQAIKNFTEGYIGITITALSDAKIFKSHSHINL